MPRGINDERSLVNLLWEKGFAAVRAPASGAATKIPRPDIVAGNRAKGLQYAIEAKTTSEKILYVEKESIDQLLEFADRFGCEPLIAVKFKGRRRSWLFVRPSDLMVTRGENYRLTFNDALVRGMDLKSMVGEGQQMRLHP